MNYTIEEQAEGSQDGFCPRGGALSLWKSKAPEVMLSGPSETGKTYACLQKLDALMWKYDGAQAVIIRKVLSSIYSSVLATYRKVLGADSEVTFYGGEKPQWADYPNGSRVFIAGIDNPQKALSSERDFIYVNQAEELDLNDWEVLTTRATGRAGNSPYSQVIGDCNPGAPGHWIRHRPSLVFLESRHEDNPMLFDEQGRMTEQGRKTLAVLDRLTGVRKDRLRHGKWVQAEGAVYEGFDRAVHLIEPFPIPPSWRRVRAVDFGYTNAFVCQWWAFDEDGRMYLYREIYHTKRTVRVHSEQIKKLERWYRVGPDREWLKDHRGEFVADPGRERISATITDHDAEDRATLEENGIPTYAAIKDFSPGQQAVEERLKVCGDGRPRLFIFRDAPVERDEELAEAKRPTNTAEEFECYVWAKDIDGRPTRERPVKEHDHGMDAMRYVIMSEDKPHGTVGIAGPAVAIERERRNFIRGSIAGPDDAQQRWDRTGAYGNPDEMSPENNWGLGSARSSRWPRR